MRNRTLVLLVFVGMMATSALAQFEGESHYPRFNFNAGGGYGIGRGDVGSFVGNSFFGVGGAGVNFGRVFGVSGEFMYYDLGIRPYVRETQGLQSTSGSLQSFSLNGIVRAPYSFSKLSGYGIFGVGFYDRRVSSSSGTILGGAIFQPSWIWWDIYCVNVQGQCRVPSSASPQTLGSSSKIAGGYNWGGGVTYPLGRWHHAKLYGEFRYHKAYQSDVQTVVWPLTIGLRW
ncbi:MAG: outer membrane beta-barrel protein [Terriglobales bacterium]